MSGERVDLDDLRTLAVAAQESADYREDMQRKGMARWTLSPRRDGTVDVVIAHDGADVFDRALLVDAAFAVAAQPAVVIALLDRITALQTLARTAASWLTAPRYGDECNDRADAAKTLADEEVVLP